MPLRRAATTLHRTEMPLRRADAPVRAARGLGGRVGGAALPLDHLQKRGRRCGGPNLCLRRPRLVNSDVTLRSESVTLRTCAKTEVGVCDAPRPCDPPAMHAAARDASASGFVNRLTGLSGSLNG
eukprot:616785-Rhodomonas_salina.7